MTTPAEKSSKPLSALALSIVASELIAQSADGDANSSAQSHVAGWMRACSAYCVRVAESYPAIDVELWAKRGERWICVGISKAEQGRYHEILTGAKTSDAARVVLIESFGALVFGGAGLPLVPEEYSSAAARVARGFVDPETQY